MYLNEKVDWNVTVPDLSILFSDVYTILTLYFLQKLPTMFRFLSMNVGICSFSVQILGRFE